MKDPIIRGPLEYQEGNRWFQITAKGGLHKLPGNKDAYFSLTGDINSGRPYYLQHWSGGCIHEDLLKHWPDLKPLKLLHLSDSQGVPTHSVANGLYWLHGALPPEACIRALYHGGTGSSAKRPEECLRILADHVRISLDEAAELRDRMTQVALSLGHYARVWEDKADAAIKVAFETWVESQKPRWAREAQQAIEQFGLIRYGD